MSKFLVALDDGHGVNTAGKRSPLVPSLGRSIRENEFNKSVVGILEKELKRCGIEVLQLAPTDEDTPLTARTKKANDAKADILVSIHFNAVGTTFDYSSAQGFSVHIQPEMKADINSAAHRLAKYISEELKNNTQQVNRGIVGQNLHMTRESNMPAVLVECGFMDDEREALLMISAAFHKECAQEIAKAICRFLGVTYSVDEGPQVRPSDTKLETKTDQYYRVRASWPNAHSQIGAFHELGTAIRLADSRRADNYKVFDPTGKVVHTPVIAVTYKMPTQTLQMYSRGDQVRLLQEALNAAGYKLKGKVDGIFGADTLQALKRFQSVFLPREIDGIAGAKTVSMLNKVLN